MLTKLIMGIGLPASGKTETLERFAAKYDYAYISVDNVRMGLGIADHNPKTERAWDEIRRRTAEFLEQGRTVVLDATFTSQELRREFLDLARKNGAERIQGVFVDTPSEIAWQRNENRERKVPEFTFQQRVHALRNFPPGVQEGFDALFTLNEYQKLIETERVA